MCVEDATHSFRISYFWDGPFLPHASRAQPLRGMRCMEVEVSQSISAGRGAEPDCQLPCSRNRTVRVQPLRYTVNLSAAVSFNFFLINATMYPRQQYFPLIFILSVRFPYKLSYIPLHIKYTYQSEHLCRTGPKPDRHAAATVPSVYSLRRQNGLPGPAKPSPFCVRSVRHG